MKKILFSFLLFFCFFISFESCQAFSVTTPSGVSYEIDEKYQTYLAFSSDSSNEYILVSEKKGIFKLEWSPGWKDYGLAFYPEGSTSPGKFDYYYGRTHLAYGSSLLPSGVAKNTCKISSCTTNVVYR